MISGFMAREPRPGLRRARSKIMAVIGAMALALVVWAAPAAGAGGRRSATFTTGSFTVTCTSTGQLCSPAEHLRFKLHRRGVLTSIAYTTAASHCSAIKLHVYRRGHQIAQTGVLATGNQTETLKTKIRLRRGVTTLAFKAQGYVGGCNVGTTGSWGGDITVTVRFPARR